MALLAAMSSEHKTMHDMVLFCVFVPQGILSCFAIHLMPLWLKFFCLMCDILQRIST